MIKTVITYGTYDLLHEGHINILRRAKEYGDRLIVGVTSEDYDRSRGKMTVVQSVEERVKAIKDLGFVDSVIVEHHKFQKSVDMQKYGVDYFVIGDDWVGKFDYLNEFTQVVYLPRTVGISSTILRNQMSRETRIGVVGTGRIAKRFVEEAKFVNTVNVRSVFSRDMTNVEQFVKTFSVPFGFDDFEIFLDSGVDAVYVATPHESHYAYVKKALLAGKHVLCEKPITLDAGELAELFEIAKQNDLVLLEAIKTAFFLGFTKILSDIQKGKIGEVKEVRASFSKLVSDKSTREWSPPYGGAVNELASYPLLLAQKILGAPVETTTYETKSDCVTDYATIASRHAGDKFSFATVAIGAKTEGSAVITGTEGYIYIPAPWWLTKKFYIRSEDTSEESIRLFNLDGDGLRYEIAEFAAMVYRGDRETPKLTYADMQSINHVISSLQNNKTS